MTSAQSFESGGVKLRIPELAKTLIKVEAPEDGSNHQHFALLFELVILLMTTIPLPGNSLTTPANKARTMLAIPIAGRTRNSLWMRPIESGSSGARFSCQMLSANAGSKCLKKV